MNVIITKNWKRISKATARKRYDNGDAVYILPAKMNPENMWQSPYNITDAAFNSVSFSDIVNIFTLENCQYNETGKYPAFYVRNENK